MSGWTLIALTAVVVLVWVGVAAALVWVAWRSEQDGY